MPGLRPRLDRTVSGHSGPGALCQRVYRDQPSAPDAVARRDDAEPIAVASQEPRRGADASHAWVEVFTPEYGWRGLDPTNNLVASEHHVKMAVGRDYRDVSPSRGAYRGGASEDLSVIVSVRPGSTDARSAGSFTRSASQGRNAHRLAVGCSPDPRPPRARLRIHERRLDHRREVFDVRAAWAPVPPLLAHLR